MTKVIKLVPVVKKPKRRPGILKGKIKISKTFNQPLPEQLLKDFEGIQN